MAHVRFWFRGRGGIPNRGVLVREYCSEDDRRVLRALSGDLPDLVLDVDNETMALGAAVCQRRRLTRPSRCHYLRRLSASRWERMCVAWK